MVAFAIQPLPISRAQAKVIGSTAWLTGFVGGRNSGKSRVGAMRIAWEAKRNQPWMAVSPDANMVRETTLPTFLEVTQLSGQYLAHVVSPTPRVFFRTRDGGVANVVFKGAEKPDKLLGSNKAGLWFDEASIISKDAFDRAIGVCRYRGHMGPVLATFTPRGFKHWTFEQFFTKIDEPQAEQIEAMGGKVHWFVGRPYLANEDSYLVHCATRENPFRPAKYEERIGRQYSAALRQQELEGDFMEIAGLMFRREWFRIVEEAPRLASRIRYWDKACVIGSTLVVTKRGLVRIDEVVKGDYVKTRKGWRVVNRSWLTKHVKKLHTIIFDDGSELTGTHDHLVWDESVCEWIELGRLSTSSRVTRWEGRETQASNISNSKVGRIHVGQHITGREKRAGNDISTATCTLGLSTENIDTNTDRCTETSGSLFTGRSPVAAISTTLTETGTITTSVIFNVSAHLNIELNTRICNQIQTLSERLKRVLLDPLKGNEQSADRATFVEKTIAQVQQTQDIVQENAIEYPSTQKTEPRTSQGWPVYDLTVDEDHEFFANGILVHNCTPGDGAYTSGVLMARDDRGIFYIEDVVRGQWGPHERDTMMEQTARSDAYKYRGNVVIYVESEGGFGREVTDNLITKLSEFPVYRDPVSAQGTRTKGGIKLPGDAKIRRAMPLSSQAENGNVRIVAGRWNGDFLDELAMFPEYVYADQCDAASAAYLKLAKQPFGDVAAEKGTIGQDGASFGKVGTLGGMSTDRYPDAPWNQNISNNQETEIWQPSRIY